MSKNVVSIADELRKQAYIAKYEGYTYLRVSQDEYIALRELELVDLQISGLGCFEGLQLTTEEY